MSLHRSGPVRSAAARDAILEATATLFEKRGYEHLTIEGIAQAAGVGKQTIYRWWPSRGALVADCLVERLLVPGELEVPDTGDAVADFRHWIDGVVALLAEESGASLARSLVAAAAADPTVGPQLQQRLGAQPLVVARLRSAQARGQLGADAPLEAIGDALFGAVVVAVLSWQPIDPAPLHALVGHLLRP